MRVSSKACAGVICAIASCLPVGAAAQDFPEQQRIVGDLLFAERVREARADALRRRRALAAARAAEQRAARQAALVQRQAAQVQALRGELQALRDERLVAAAAEAFDAAYAARDWARVRSLLADAVTMDVPGSVGVRTVAADALIAEWTASAGRATGVPPRSARLVRVDGDGAVAASGGPAGASAGPPRRGAGGPGDYEVRFVRAADGWRIDGLSFRPRTPAG